MTATKLDGSGSRPALELLPLRRVVTQLGDLEALGRKPAAQGDAAAHGPVQLDGNLRDGQRRLLETRLLGERDRGDRQDRPAVLGHLLQRLTVVPAGEELLHHLPVRVAVIPLQDRLLVLEPGEDDLLAAAGLRRLDAEAAGSGLQGGY